jgi:hypothetical protein
VFWVFVIFALEFAVASLPFLVVLCFLAITIQHITSSKLPSRRNIPRLRVRL